MMSFFQRLAFIPHFFALLSVVWLTTAFPSASSASAALSASWVFAASAVRAADPSLSETIPVLSLSDFQSVLRLV